MTTASRQHSRTIPGLGYAIGGFLCMASVMGIGRFIYTPILPGMLADTGINTADAGFIASANFVGYLLGALAAGYGWSAGRERAVVIAGLVASALLCLAMALAGDVWSFAVIRFAAGFVSAITMIIGTTIVLSHILLLGRPQLGAVHFGGVGFGIAASALLVAAIHFAGSGWRADWIGAALLSAVFAAAFVLLVDEGPAGGANGGREPAVPASFAYHALTFAYTLCGFGYVITATFIIAIVRNSGGDAVMEAFVWVLAGVCAGLSNWIWSPILGRIGVFFAFAVASILEAIGVAASVMLAAPIGPIIGSILLGLTFMALTAFAIQGARLLAPLSPKRAIARLTLGFSLGQIVGPWVAGIMAQVSGSFTAPSLIAALVLVVAATAACSAGKYASKTVQ
ncbi:YbfB/YjiJ family MFS transporter [Daeguia caeni]|uniref:YbfB/YjiJ family MFS transporter n=1 Tax=Daeguia caeni TaxID=439612 RepID=A0ABV9H724_9HYPH